MDCKYPEKGCVKRGTPECNDRCCPLHVGYSVIREIVCCTREVPCSGGYLCNMTCSYHGDRPENKGKPRQKAISPDRTGQFLIDWRGFDPTLKRRKQR